MRDFNGRAEWMGVRLVVLALAAAGAGLLAGAAAPGGRGAGAPAGVCMARYTGPGNRPPQRLDDIFWENDRIAHRIYGPTLATPAGENLTTSGIDVWVKKVHTLFMDKQLMTGQQHDDHGEGLDCYDVQQTCGCGGLGIWDDVHKKLMRSGNWSDKGGFVSGPEVASFWVAYAPWDIGNGLHVDEKRTFTLPAGTNFTRLVSTIKFDHMGPTPDQLLVGIGIAKRKTDGSKFKGEDHLLADEKAGVLAYWEPEQFYKNASVGHTGCALRFDPASFVKFIKDDPDQNMVILKVTPGKPWVYYLGACWDKGLDFHSREEWEKYTDAFKADFDASKK